MKETNFSVNQPQKNEQKPEIFWLIDAGEALIDEQILYDNLYRKGYRYYQNIKGGQKQFMWIKNNSLDAYYGKLRYFIFLHLKEDFPFLSADEITPIKRAIKELGHSLKLKKLVKVTEDDLLKYDVPDFTKNYLKNLDRYSQDKKGNKS